MTVKISKTQQDAYWAHIAPFASFMLIMAVPDLLDAVGIAFGQDTRLTEASVWGHRQLWLYPLQTLACVALLIFYRRSYPWKPISGVATGIVAGIVGISLWILPGFLFQRFQITFLFSDMLGVVDRSDGFNSRVVLDDQPAAAFWFWATRLLRLIVVVPVMEEVFWRSFLMRYLADSKIEFYDAKFGQHSMIGFVVVTALFVAAHQPVDYFGAICFGLLAYWVTVRTKSLTAVIVMHAVANASLAAYAVSYDQWGYL